MAGSVGPYTVYLALSDTSACFVIYRTVMIPVDVDDEERKGIVLNSLRERRVLHQDLLAEGQDPIQRIAPQLDGIVPAVPSYVFSFYVYEGISESDKKTWEPSFKFLADPAYLGLEPDEGPDDDNDLDFHQYGEWIPPDIEDIDLDSTSSVYVTWSSIVACTWGSPGQIARTKSMLLGMEIKMQSAWNKCYALSQQIDRIIVDERTESNPDLILIGFTGLCTKASNHKPVTTRLVRRHLWMSPGGFSMSKRFSIRSELVAELTSRLMSWIAGST